MDTDLIRWFKFQAFQAKCLGLNKELLNNNDQPPYTELSLWKSQLLQASFIFFFHLISVSLKCVAQPETLAVLRRTFIFKAGGFSPGEGDDYEDEHLFADMLAPGGV